jgi:hypothetical protein
MACHGFLCAECQFQTGSTVTKMPWDFGPGSSVSDVTKMVNGRKTRTKVVVENGVETRIREEWQEGTLTSRTVDGVDQVISSAQLSQPL